VERVFPLSGMVEKELPGASPRFLPVRGGDRPGMTDKPGRLRRACQDFESIFIYTLLKTMRAGLAQPQGMGLHSGLYTSMGDLEVARFLARGRGIGLADLVFEQLNASLDEPGAGAGKRVAPYKPGTVWNVQRVSGGGGVTFAGSRPRDGESTGEDRKGPAERRNG